MRFSEVDDLEPFLESSDPFVLFVRFSIVDRELEVEREREWFLSFFFTTHVSRFSLSGSFLVLFLVFFLVQLNHSRFSLLALSGLQVTGSKEVICT